MGKIYDFIFGAKKEYFPQNLAIKIVGITFLYYSLTMDVVQNRIEVSDNFGLLLVSIALLTYKYKG